MSMTRVFSAPMAAALAAALAGCPGPSTGNGDGGSGDGGGLVPICSVNAGVSGFGIEHVLGQAYWYSRYNMLSLNLQSGNGDPVVGDTAAGAVMTMAQMGDAMNAMIMMASGTDTVQAMPPNAPGLIRRVYDTGNPGFASQVTPTTDPLDFGAFRWTPIAAGDQATTSGETFGWMLAKIVEWDRQFHVDAHFGVPGPDTGTEIPGAQQRFAGLALFAEGLAMAREMMMDNMMNGQLDLYSMASPKDMYVTLLGLADLAMLISVDQLEHSTTNRYRMLAQAMLNDIDSANVPAGQMAGMFDPPILMDMTGTRIDFDGMMGMMSQMMMDMVGMLPDTAGIGDSAIAVQSLTWVLGAVPPAMQANIQAKLVVQADTLIAQSPSTAAELAYTIRGAIDAWRITGEQKYFDAAADAYNALEEAYDCGNGVFTNQTRYDGHDIAAIVGGLNAAMNFIADENATDAIEFDRAVAVLTGFWESTVNISGFQQAAPPSMAPFVPDYEFLGAPLFHRYGDPADGLQPPPPMIGANGSAPVFVKSVTWDPAAESWTSEAGFDTAAAMHLANEALWLHVDEVNGFPGGP